MERFRLARSPEKKGMGMILWDSGGKLIIMPGGENRSIAEEAREKQDAIYVALCRADRPMGRGDLARAAGLRLDDVTGNLTTMTLRFQDLAENDDALLFLTWKWQDGWDEKVKKAAPINGKKKKKKRRKNHA